MRSHIGLTCEHIVLHEYETSMAWGRAGLDMTESVLGISHHPLYGLFVKTTTYMYEGQAWMMACYAAARIGASGDIAANQHLIDRAKEFLRQAQYRWGDYLVDSIIDYVLYETKLKPQETERIGPLGAPSIATDERLKNLVRFRPDDLQVREDVELPVPKADSVRLPSNGEVNAYGFVVDSDLAAANAAILAGDYSDAITRLDQIAERETDPLRRWHAAEQAAKTLILAGRSSEAIERVDDLEAREIAFFGSNLGARALRAETKFWLGDNEGALRDFLQVVEALGDFRPPALLVFKPEVPQVALMTRAQYLSYLGIARSLMYQGAAEQALPWAEAAEELFEEAHYTWQHQLYRRYLKLDADMFYARGINLAVLAGARLSNDGDREAAEDLVADARAYLDAMGFDAGLVTIEATWAQALLESGDARGAADVADKATSFAIAEGQTDMLWQLQALRGEALQALGRDNDAERAFRAAQAAIDSVSGSLASDASKRQFGVGKEEITRRLVAYDLERDDLAQAYADLERARSRAFVDMLGSLRLSSGRGGAQVDRIRDVDARIRSERIRAATPGQSGRGATERVKALEQRRGTLIAQLKTRDADLADALSIANQNLGALQERLGRGDVLLYTLPQLSEEKTIRNIRVERGGARLLDTGITSDELEAALSIYTSDDPICNTG
ncbi:MAG: hypothetical protein AAF317_16880, partial [Pseudomonadota bacterium]